MSTSRTHETEQLAERPLLSDLRSRADIDALLQHFYVSVFHDHLLRHIFIDVAQMDLKEHLPVIGDFWEKVLFNTGTYTGNAMRVHRQLSHRAACIAVAINRNVNRPTPSGVPTTGDRLHACPDHQPTSSPGRSC